METAGTARQNLQQFRDATEYEGLTFAYLPPGTYSFGPQSASVCPDGSYSSFGQEFVVHNAAFKVWYSLGDRGFAHDASAGRIREGAVSGKPAVIIDPLTPDGFGRSWIVWRAFDGLIIFEAMDLPIEESVKIVEGVKCEGC
jgi:hypothetical protein